MNGTTELQNFTITCMKNLDMEFNRCTGCGKLALSEASWWRIVIVFIISFLAVPTNLLVIIVVHQTTALHNNQCIYMVALAVSDLSAGLCFLCTSFRYAITGYGPTTRLELDLGAWMYYLALTTGLLLTVSIGLDKLHQINWPYSYDSVMTRRKVVGIVIGIWLGIAFLSSLPTRIFPISGYYYEFTSSTLMFNTKSCRDENQPDNSLVIVRISLLLFLLLMLFVGYGTILIISRRHINRMRHMQQFSAPPTRQLIVAAESSDLTCTGAGKPRQVASSIGNAMQNQWDRTKASLRGWITNACIILGFLVCWLPFFLYKIFIAKSSSSQTESTQFCFAWFAISYTSLNAVIYGGTYKPFKVGLAKFLNRNRNSRNHQMEMEQRMLKRSCNSTRRMTKANDLEAE